MILSIDNDLSIGFPVSDFMDWSGREYRRKETLLLYMITVIILFLTMLESVAALWPNFKITLRTNPRLRKGEELSFWIMQKIMTILCFPATVRQCNIACSVVHVQLGFKIIFIYVAFLPARVAAMNKAYLCFRLVCASEKSTNAHPLKSSKISTNIQPLLQIRRSY